MSLLHGTIKLPLSLHLPPTRPRAKPPGSTYKRCGCTDPLNGRRFDTTCPLLRWSDHGSWYFYVALPAVAGQRRRIRRGGFATEIEARAAMWAELDRAGVTVSTPRQTWTLDTIREYLATLVSPTPTPGTRRRVRKEVRQRVRRPDLIRLSSTPRAKGRP